MKSLRTVFVGGSVFLMIVSFGVWSFGQDNVKFDREKLVNLIDSPETEAILAAKIGGYSKVIFDKNTLAFDFFKKDVIVATVDFEHVGSGKHGTVSFAYRWVSGDFFLIYTSYWFWGTAISGGIGSDWTWNAAGSPYYVQDETWVLMHEILTIEPGTVVRFRKSAGAELVVEGWLLCDGAIFTTSCDFEDKDQWPPNSLETEWGGISIVVDGGCAITNSLVEFASGGLFAWYTAHTISISDCTLRKCNPGIQISEAFGSCLIQDNIITNCYRGFSCSETDGVQITGNTITGPDYRGEKGISFSNSSGTISSNSISFFSKGISCDNSSPEISLNAIQHDNYGIYCSSSSLPIVYNNNIEQNNYYGLYNEDSLVTVNAENNWWGDASGPYHPTLNPGGLGDEVSDYVDFEPWLTSVVTAVVAALMGRK